MNMTDIVERLHRTAGLGIINSGLMEEAADEIESARRVCDSYAAENQRFSDEIERLRAETKRLQAALIEAAEMVNNEDS
jgi:hypothetical protein